MIADLNLTCSAPSTTSVFASVKVPVPLTHSTPLALNSNATPCVTRLTTSAFHSFALENSSSGSPIVTPS